MLEVGLLALAVIDVGVRERSIMPGKDGSASAYWYYFKASDVECIISISRSSFAVMSVVIAVRAASGEKIFAKVRIESGKVDH